MYSWSRERRASRRPTGAAGDPTVTSEFDLDQEMVAQTTTLRIVSIPTRSASEVTGYGPR
jgi:hypothetical protein